MTGIFELRALFNLVSVKKGKTVQVNVFFDTQ